MIDDFDLDEIKALLGEDMFPEEKKPARPVEPEIRQEQPVRRTAAPELNREPERRRRTAEPELSAERPARQERPSRSALQERPVRQERTERPVRPEKTTANVSTSARPVKQREPEPEEPAPKDRAALRKEKKARKKQVFSAIVRSAPFFIALFLMTAVAWNIPARPTVSESEKRALKTFPEFSVSDLFSGTYFSNIDDWFADTFTFREDWIMATNQFKDLYGINDVEIVGQNESHAVPIAAEEPGQVESEHLPAEEQTPAGNPESVPGTSGEEPVEISTEEPEEDVWGGDVAGDDADLANSGQLLKIKNSAYKITGYSEYYGDLFVKIMNSAVERLDGKANLYLSIVPENGTFMLQRKDREYYGFYPEEDAFEKIYSQLDPAIKTVNVIPNLVKHNDEYIAFRTDHHWTAVGAYYAYEAWCEVAGVEPVPLSEYEMVEWEGFLGTYYYTAGMDKTMGETPDTVQAFIPPGNVTLYMNYSTNDKLGIESPILVDRSTSKPGGKYMTFLGTDDARATFVNEDIADDSAVMVIKTSFGNPYVYYLTQHYHYVYVVDYRYYKVRALTNFVNQFNIDDVIIIGGIGFLAEEGGINILSTFLK